MATSILFKFIDAKQLDPELDRGCYKEGDLVCELPSGDGNWNAIKPPAFFIVHVPNLEPGEVEFYKAPLEEIEMVTDEEGNLVPRQKILRRTRMNFKIPKLPKCYVDEIYATGQTTIGWELLKTCIEHRHS